MNLVTGDWIPIIDQQGVNRFVSLSTLYAEACQISDLSVSPPVRIALMRLLICITQAALKGPEDEQDWKACKKRITPSVTDYLNTYQDKFNLYGDTPFLQATNLEPIDNATLDKLDFTLSAGNNSVLFDHEACPSGRPHSPGWCARMLLTYQCFSPGGKIGVTKWNQKATAQKSPGESEHSPAIEGSALHMYLRGDNLLTTIWMNLLTKNTVSSLPGMTFGKPIWETSVASGETEEAKGVTGSYLGRIVPLSRAISLSPQKLTLTLVNGLSYPKLPAQREVSATVVRRGKGTNERDMYVSVNMNRHPWRELASLLTLHNSSLTGGCLALEHLHHLQEDFIDIWTGGMAADKGKILDMAEWNFTLPLNILKTTMLHRYELGVELAQKGEYNLKDAIKAWHLMAVDSTGISKVSCNNAQTFYWSQLDREYGVLLNAVNEELSFRETWYPQVWKAMNSAFEYACPHTTPRQIQAFAKAKQEKLRLQKPED